MGKYRAESEHALGGLSAECAPDESLRLLRAEMLHDLQRFRDVLVG